VIVPDIDLFIK